MVKLVNKIFQSIIKPPMAEPKKPVSQRMSFWDIFKLPESKYMELTPKVRVAIGGVTMGPGVSIGTGVTFGGFSLFDPKIYKSDVLVKKEKGYLRIMGFFPEAKS